MQDRQKYRNSGLDLFRVVAFILVLITHSLFVLDKFYPKFRNFAFVGNLALDMFYALSGFLIGNIFIKNFIDSDFTFKKVLEFLKNRWLKTLPTYYLIVLISLVVSYLVNGNFQDFNLSFLFFLQNIHEADFFFFPISYSLAIEEWFYLSFPLVFFSAYCLFKKVSKKQIFLGVTLFYVLFATVFRFYKYFHFPDLHWDTAFRKSILTRFDATSYGLILSYLNTYKKQFVKNNTQKIVAMGCVGIILSILAKMKVHNFLIYTLYFNFMPISITFVLVKFIDLSPIKASFAGIFKEISLSSYCFYLVHLQLVYIPLSTYWQAQSLPEAFLQCICMYVLALGLGFLLYRTVEVPMVQLKDKVRIG
jgi:peptidoglycan/LPS O-acetylase OafA/YrhL